METEDIDFQAVELLQTAPSKKYLKKIVEYCFMIRNKILSFEQYYQTPVSIQFHSELQLTEQQSHKIIISMVKLIELAANNGFQDVAALFPGNFQEQLKGLLSDLIKQSAENWTNVINQKICQADRLVDIDWRLDVQVASNNEEKMKKPVVFMQLEMQGPQNNEGKTLDFQMNAQELNTFYNNLKKIKEQLNSLVSD